MLITAWSAAYHLAGMAAVLKTGPGIASLYALASGAAEAAVVGCYLSEVGVSSLERVRRNMNCNLDGICQDLNMLRRFDGPDGAQRIAGHQAQLEAIKRAGAARLDVHAAEQGPVCLPGDEPPRTMTLIDQCVSQTPGLRAVSHWMLSGVAHARLHGLSHLLMTSPTAQPGKVQVQVQMNVASNVLAQQLLVGLPCETTLVEHMRWFLGWDTEKIGPAATRMEAIWRSGRELPMSPSWGQDFDNRPSRTRHPRLPKDEVGRHSRRAERRFCAA